jgi:transcriptional regulator with XRE-family HTH domain
MREPQGRIRHFSDDELRRGLDEGLTTQQLADRFGVSPQAINKRRRNLEVSTVSAVVAPGESRRFVSRTIDAMAELTRGLHRANLLQDACDEWLRDAEDPERYDVGPRAGEVWVTYLEEIGDGKRIPRKATLQALLDEVGAVGSIEKSESKHSDPRELILKTCQEVRQTVATAADLARMLADAQVMERFREAVLAEIAKESPEVAERIAQAVRRGLVVAEAFRGPESLPFAGG